MLLKVRCLYQEISAIRCHLHPCETPPLHWNYQPYTWLKCSLNSAPWYERPFSPYTWISNIGAAMLGLFAATEWSNTRWWFCIVCSLSSISIPLTLVKARHLVNSLSWQTDLVCMRGDEAWKWARCWFHHLSEVVTTPDSSDRMSEFTRTSSIGQPRQQRKKWATGTLEERTGALRVLPLTHGALEAISGITQPVCHILLKATGKDNLSSQIPW